MALLVLPLTLVADENCNTPTLSCEVMDLAYSTLKLKQDQIKDFYSSPDGHKGLPDFEKDISSYLAIHNQVAGCPSFKGECPTFVSKKWMGPKNGITMTHEYESFGSPCALRRPVIIYDLNDQTVAQQIGSNISIRIESRCQPNLYMSFTAYKEGLLVMAGREVGGRFESNEVARRIPLDSSDVSLEAIDTRTLRINWKNRNKTQWIDIDAEAMTFKDSNFMKVDQINSGSCKVEKLEQPAPICEKNRKALIKHKVIKSPDEYECYEYVPLINGVPNRISRG